MVTGYNTPGLPEPPPQVFFASGKSRGVVDFFFAKHA